MPRGANAKREHEYEELKERFEKSGRYGNRAEEVAARIVNKQRAEYGETKGEKEEKKEGKSPDRGLPIENYREKTIAQISGELKRLSKGDLGKIDRYESQHKDRKGVHEAIARAKAA